MECGAFYLRDVNLHAHWVEGEPATTALRAFFRVGRRAAPHPACLKSSSHIPRLSGLDHVQFGQAEEADGDIVFIMTSADWAEVALLIMNGT